MSESESGSGFASSSGLADAAELKVASKAAFAAAVVAASDFCLASSAWRTQMDFGADEAIDPSQQGLIENLGQGARDGIIGKGKNQE